MVMWVFLLCPIPLSLSSTAILTRGLSPTFRGFGAALTAFTTTAVHYRCFAVRVPVVAVVWCAISRLIIGVRFQFDLLRLGSAFEAVWVTARWGGVCGLDIT